MIKKEQFMQLISIQPVKIEGEWETRQIKINGVEISPKASQTVVNHSPDGFAWGYAGSGPSQLALSIVLHFVADRKLAARLYQPFKWDYVSNLPQSDFDVTIDIGKWMEENINPEYIID